jgi:hypothetical protein
MELGNILLAIGRQAKDSNGRVSMVLCNVTLPNGTEVKITMQSPETTISITPVAC